MSDVSSPDAFEGFDSVLRLQGVLTGREDTEENTDGELVASRIDLFAPRLFRGHVRNGSLADPGSGQMTTSGGFENAEVSEFDLTERADQDIRGAYVPVYESDFLAVVALRVEISESECDLGTDEEPNGGIRRRVLHQFAEFIAFDQFHPQVPDASVDAEILDTDEILVLELGAESGLPDELPFEFRVTAVAGKEHLDGDVLLEAAVAPVDGAEDFAASTPSEPLDELISSQDARKFDVHVPPRVGCFRAATVLQLEVGIAR